MVEQLDHPGGVGRREDHLDLWENHLQVPGVAIGVIDKQENLEHKVFFPSDTSPPERRNSCGTSP